MDEYALNEDHFKLVIICDGFKVILYLPLENLEGNHKQEKTRAKTLFKMDFQIQTELKSLVRKSLVPPFFLINV